jgi:SAM-dependent methyltransferase
MNRFPLNVPFRPEHFRRLDESPDPFFYVEPRYVVHIDEHAIAAATDLYRRLLPAGGRVLDLMSSWRSHLPDDVAYASVTGLGLNAEEMADNPQLTDFVVHDLNRHPVLPFAEAAFDGAICTVSVQYLTQPVAVFREVGRVLTAGAPFIVTFSNRCFPTKAVRLWLESSDAMHIRIVEAYFHQSGAFGTARYETYGDPIRRDADPLYAVWAFRSDARL